MASVDVLAHAYQPRLGRFASDERFGHWPLKLDGLAAPETGVRPALLARTLELPGDAPLEFNPAGCVWELGIVEFERRAWIEDVIGNPAGPDLERYLTRRFDGLI